MFLITSDVSELYLPIHPNLTSEEPLQVNKHIV